MGGIGSGNWYRWDKRTTIEETKRIDIRYMRKQSLLEPGRSGSLSWTIGGEPSGDIRFSCYPDHLNLHYRFRRYGGEWKSVEQRINLEFTSCNYGGRRPWFTCPGCERRVAILCGYDKLFLCRHCYQLPYGSQHEDSFSRWIRKREKIRKRAFDDSGYRKRKHLHHATFERLLSEFCELDWLCDSYLEKRLGGHL